jgi:predicted kinase
MTTPKLYMLIGVPGSGKSTWISNQDWTKDIPVVSSDRFIDYHAAKEGKTYNDVFADYVKIATKLMDNQVEICKANNTDIIWDQTNTSAKSRKAKLAKLEGYKKIAIVFKTPDKEELDKRLAQRVGKHIPTNVMESMIANLEMPSEEEGFEEIWYAS